MSGWSHGGGYRNVPSKERMRRRGRARLIHVYARYLWGEQVWFKVLEIPSGKHFEDATEVKAEIKEIE